MFGLGAGEIFVIAVLALIFIGPKKLPELAKGLGKGIREFQKAKNDLLNEVNNPSEEEPSSSERTGQVISETQRLEPISDDVNAESHLDDEEACPLEKEKKES